MKYDPDHHHRRSLRLRGYDYRQPGTYFVTAVLQDRECLLGEVVNDEMCLNEPGRMVQSVWQDTPSFYPGVGVDSFIVMPNHIHAILVLDGARRDGGETSGGRVLSVGDVIQRLKTLTTRRYVDGVQHQGWRPFRKRLWQRNYYEHIVRDAAALRRFQEYVVANPLRWQLDEDNPAKRSPC